MNHGQKGGKPSGVPNMGGNQPGKPNMPQGQPTPQKPMPGGMPGKAPQSPPGFGPKK